ncbi:tetratricopeptide (TPR) repeat protein [Metabacillus crassostreae]|uniref:tetratricopeptide repeat protein n=1 Tax=Metabacillus crassostreae TaxID=929098 RepID=UPI00195EB40E|nr:tetratricopeptide repeat protein [Metabacillus crassostreae]MBM7605723.1 tetratricopeptide (TPR) repeat protein [Metabacillus crassostreae]
MKEDKRSNVIPFPNLKEKFLDKGMALLKEKKYTEALGMFSEAKALNEDKAEIYLGMAICLMELGELNEAKDVCKKMLQEDIGHYFTVLQIYLTILIQLREYQEVQATIEAVLEENTLPAESAEHFYKLLEFSRKMTQNQDDIVEDLEETQEPTMYIEDILEDVSKQMSYVESLRDRNISKHFSSLKVLLENPMTHPMVKTMILHLMIENEISKEVTVTKFGESISIIPSELNDISDHLFTKKVLNILDDTLGIENPTLYEAVKEIWIRHLYVLYPFLPKPTEEKLWAAALQIVGYEMHGIGLEIEEIEQLYDKSISHLEEACQKIYQIEEISYMQI